MKQSKEKNLPSSACAVRERIDLCVSRTKRYGYLPADAF